MRKKISHGSKKRFYIGNRGFSLIEILVVVTALILISGFGFTTLVFTQRRQAVDQTAIDVKQFIERAKYNAVSHVKPADNVFHSSCTEKIPYVYELDIRPDTVIMNVLCKNPNNPTLFAAPYTEKKFPTRVTITRNGCLKFAFDVATNSIACTNPSESLPSLITIAYPDGSYQKTLNIDTSGNVSIQ